MIRLYSTNCPKCKVLGMKMKQKHIEYEEFTDIDAMLAMGIKSAPLLQVDDGKLLDFAEAVKWVNAQ